MVTKVQRGFTPQQGKPCGCQREQSRKVTHHSLKSWDPKWETDLEAALPHLFDNPSIDFLKLSSP